MEGKSEIHMIWNGGASWGASHNNGFKQHMAYRSPKLECIVMQKMDMDDGLLFSDIILPICTMHEVNDLVLGWAFEVACMAIVKKSIAPIGEAKSDYEAVLEVAKKLGWYDKLTEGMSVDDLIKKGYETSGITDVISWEELNEKQYITFGANPDWEKQTPPANLFYNDPVKNPLVTPSGKLEFESQLLKDNFPDDKERPPVAHYVRGGPPEEGWCNNEDRLISSRAKKYPLLVVCGTGLFTEHGQHADYPWAREAYRILGYDGFSYAPIWINPLDASARGIENGDIVRMYNERGGVLGGAVVTDRVISGAMVMYQGGGSDDIIPGELNRGGNPILFAHWQTNRYMLMPKPHLVGWLRWKK
jgi:trimethylamine-N-oxide reductase (cytochrome c)